MRWAALIVGFARNPSSDAAISLLSQLAIVGLWCAAQALEQRRSLLR
jgi:hypothetical protein